MMRTDPLQAFLIDSRFRILRHILLIAMIVIVIAGAVESIPVEITGENRLWMQVGYSILLMGGIYLNILWAVKRFLLRDELFHYLLFVVISGCLILFGIALMQMAVYDMEQVIEKLSFSVFIINLFSSLVNLGLMLAGIAMLVLLKYWNISNLRKNELQEITLQSELANLKTQINPHFLFNMLNNAHVLIRKQRPEASEVLFKLEDLLRYQLGESSKERVALRSDIRFMKDFLNLEKVRRDHFHFVLSETGDIENILLPPLLFIPFVENAVKYSQDSEHPSYVLLSFEVDQENRLHFTCINSKPVKERQKNATGGLGLQNIRRRLELLYPGRHTLSIIDEKMIYRVKLVIQISS